MIVDCAATPAVLPHLSLRVKKCDVLLGGTADAVMTTLVTCQHLGWQDQQLLVLAQGSSMWVEGSTEIRC